MIDRLPPHLVSAANTALAALDAARTPACSIGGMVISRWGQPRAGREFADLKEDPDLLRPFEDALRKAGTR